MGEKVTIFLIAWFILSWIFILANHVELQALFKLSKDMVKEIKQLKETQNDRR